MLKEPLRAAAQGLPNCNLIAFPFPISRNSNRFQPLDELAGVEIDAGKWLEARNSAQAALLLCQVDYRKVEAFLAGMIEENPRELEIILAAHEEHLVFLKSVVAVMQEAGTGIAHSLDRLNASWGA